MAGGRGGERDGGREGGREEHTSDQDEGKRTAVTISGNINILLLARLLHELV